MQQNPRQSWILDSMPWIPDSRYWIPVPVPVPVRDPDSLSVELGLLNLIVSGIPSCIPDSKAKDSGFYEQNFIGFRIQQPKSSRIPESILPYVGRKRVSGDK